MKKSYVLYFILIAAIVFVIDRITKFLILSQGRDGTTYFIPIINTGTFFSLFQGHNTMFTVISMLILTLVLYLFRTYPQFYIELGLIFGGALSNLIDRLIHGGIVDFINFRVWPIFNLADVAITIGIIMVAIKFIFGKSERKK